MPPPLDAILTHSSRSAASLRQDGRAFIAVRAPLRSTPALLSVTSLPHAQQGGSDPWVRIFDFETGAELECLKGHHGPVHCLRYAPDGGTIASGCALRGRACAFPLGLTAAACSCLAPAPTTPPFDCGGLRRRVPERTGKRRRRRRRLLPPPPTSNCNACEPPPAEECTAFPFAATQLHARVFCQRSDGPASAPAAPAAAAARGCAPSSSASVAGRSSTR